MAKNKSLAWLLVIHLKINITLQILNYMGLFKSLFRNNKNKREENAKEAADQKMADYESVLNIVPKIRGVYKLHNERLHIVADSLIISKKNEANVILELNFIQNDKQVLALTWDNIDMSSVPHDVLAKVLLYDNYEIDFNKW